MNKHTGQGLYISGIIDMLQEYNLERKTQSFLKELRYGDYGMSAVPPLEYAMRFLVMMKRRLSTSLTSLADMKTPKGRKASVELKDWREVEDENNRAKKKKLFLIRLVN